MNIHVNTIDRDVSDAEAEAALAVLRDWVVKTGEGALESLDPATARIVNYPALSREYP